MSEKSFIANIEEFILKRTKPKLMDSQSEVDDFLAKKSQMPDKPPSGIFKSFDFNGMQVFSYGDANAKNLILFIHGGAYVNEINLQHHLYCLKMSRKLDAYVLSPVYPLAPNHKASETFNLIADLYENLKKNHTNITLMGDSAGGGFILAFAQYIKTLNLAQPTRIITFSPWVDVSMSNPPYDSVNDPILGEIGLKEIGKSWAGDWDTKDFRVSPIYGDNTGLAPMLIFAGTNEIFYRDIKKYTERLENDNVDFKFIEADGLFHIYPMFPSPEAKKAFKEIKKEIM